MDVQKKWDLGTPVLGCDIGNGFASVAFLDAADVDVRCILPPKYDKQGIPTDTYIKTASLADIQICSEVKGMALRSMHRNPERTIRAIKRYLDLGTLRVEGVNDPVSVFDIYGAIVRDVMTLVINDMKTKQDAVYDIAYTFPVSLRDKPGILERLDQTFESIEIDGHRLHVVNRLPEPAAIAIDHLYYSRHLASEDVRVTSPTMTEIVYDLGHGTFDAAVVTASEEGEPYVVIDQGDVPDVGGQNFDDVIKDMIIEALANDYHYTPQNRNELERIRELAVEAKHALSEDNTRSYLIEFRMANEDYAEISITREAFEQASQSLLMRTLEVIQELLTSSKNKGVSIDCIVLSGGSSNMPMVKKGVEALVGNAIPVRIHRPNHAVAFGAARYGRMKTLKDHKAPLIQRTDHNYGVRVGDSMHVMIPYGTALPAVSEPFVIRSESSEVDVIVMRDQNRQVETDVNYKECKEILRHLFEIPHQSTGQLSIKIFEDYKFSITCSTSKGIETYDTRQIRKDGK